jgi:hypothetical protein
VTPTSWSLVRVTGLSMQYLVGVLCWWLVGRMWMGEVLVGAVMGQAGSVQSQPSIHPSKASTPSIHPSLPNDRPPRQAGAHRSMSCTAR